MTQNRTGYDGCCFQGIEARFLERIQHVSEKDFAQIDFAIDVLQSKVFYPAKPPQ